MSTKVVAGSINDIIAESTLQGRQMFMENLRPDDITGLVRSLSKDNLCKLLRIAIARQLRVLDKVPYCNEWGTVLLAALDLDKKEPEGKVVAKVFSALSPATIRSIVGYAYHLHGMLIENLIGKDKWVLESIINESHFYCQDINLIVEKIKSSIRVTRSFRMRTWEINRAQQSWEPHIDIEPGFIFRKRENELLIKIPAKHQQVSYTSISLYTARDAIETDHYMMPFIQGIQESSEAFRSIIYIIAKSKDII